MALKYEEIPSEMIRELASFSSLRAVLLFGSFARGEVTRKSDIDLLLVFDSSEKAKKAEDRVTEVVEKYSGEVKRTIVPLCIGLEEFSSDVEFFYNVFSEGLVLYKRPDNEPILPAATGGYSPMLIYSFDLSGLERKKKMEVSRQLYGIRFGKRGKEYAYKGMVERKGGLRLGRGVIMVPASAEEEFDEFFRARGIPFEKRSVILLLGR